MNYKIKLTPPPNIYEKAQRQFGVDFYKGVVFTYGDTIHVWNGKLSDDLLVHELTHVKQQLTYPGGKEGWWERYFRDEQFRFDQEIEAYRAQYKKVCQMTGDRNQRYRDLLFFAKSMMHIYSFQQLELDDVTRLIKMI